MLREELSLRLFEKGVRRMSLGPVRDEIAGDLGRLHTEELYNLYCSPNIRWVIKSRVMCWWSWWLGGGDIAFMVLMRGGET